MDTTEIKKEIIDRIFVSDDQEFLQEINILLQSQQSAMFLDLSPEMEEKLNRGSTQIKNGQCMEQEDLDKSVEEWLKEE